MSEEKNKDDNPLNARLVKLETVVEFHTTEIAEIKSSVADLREKLDTMEKSLSEKIDALRESTTGVKWFVERILLPLVITVLTIVVAYALHLPK
ncbi:MAG: hypothetical protein ACPLZG_12370 [Thermoproteota archaeon]